MQSVTAGWRLLHIGFEGDSVELDGIQLWDADWSRSLGEVVVAHPQHPSQRHTMSIRRVRDRSVEVEFAAGEFSNGVWGFFQPVPKHET